MSLLDGHNNLTVELTDALRVLGDTRGQLIARQTSVWEQTKHLGITERREEVRFAGSDYLIMIAEQEAEIEALRAELHHIELELTHGGT